EGGWAEHGKGETVWDRFSREDRVFENQTTDLACDHYHKVDYNVYLLRESLLEKGVAYYDKMIDTLLHHWDLPQALHDLGVWENDSTVEAFKEFSDFCFSHYGDRIKTWITFSSPKLHGGKVGIALYSDWAEPRNPSSDQDVAAAEHYLNFMLGWFAHPIFVDGDYPAMLKEQTEKKKDLCGKELARLPVFTEAEKQRIQGTADFFGLNHHTSRLITESLNSCDAGPNNVGDFQTHSDPTWLPTASDRIQSVPVMRQLLNLTHIYMHSLLAHNLDGVRVKGYITTSLMDFFKWLKDSSRPRTPKRSAHLYFDIMRNNGFPLPAEEEMLYGHFQKGFIWSTATAAYQVQSILTNTLYFDSLA
uniref:Lactase n=1 Tax=Cyprinus carpio TaxID=7962 RepID=A0A8C2H736_CYPCA